MHDISIFGTSSDAGKSTLSFVIGRLLQEKGYKVAPFKAQNVSNNAIVADDGSEIAIAQYFQAKVLGVKSSWHNNPILLKSGRGSRASLIVAGESTTTPEVREYYHNLDSLKPIVKSGFEKLKEEFDCIIAEGAGSPVELNLMDKDLSNIFIAKEFNTKIILVADIEKGGVFASIYGVYNLLPRELRENVIGVIVNKFRGDMSLFDSGVKIIEERFGIPVLGVLPYTPFALGLEDSQSLKALPQNCTKAKRKVAIIAYPTMSNYNDFEPLIANDELCVEFISSNQDLSSFDMIILPGSKLVFEDLKWLKSNGLFEQIIKHKIEERIEIIGICGGYEMMFKRLIDEQGVEAKSKSSVEGFGFIDDVIYFQDRKILRREGDCYEIHYGVSQKYPKEYRDKNLYGTFLHGLFIDEEFKSYEKRAIESFIEKMRVHIDIERIYSSVS